MAKDLVDDLAARGHRISVITSRSLYGQRGAALPRRQRIGNVEVHRSGISLFGRAGLAARAADFALFYALGLARLITLPQPDVVVSLTTPPFLALAGLICRALRGSRAVYWVMDLYPDVPIACGVMRSDSPAARALAHLNLALLRRSDACVVLGRCMRQQVLDKGVPPSRVAMIPVWGDAAGIVPVPPQASTFRRRWVPANAFTVMYSGNFGIAHETDTLCQAMLRLRAHADVRFVFVGGGARRGEIERFMARHRVHGLWHDYVPRHALGDTLAAGDVHLISLRPGVEGLIVPSKLYGIMAAGRPAIFIGHRSSEVARVIEEFECGVVVPPGDVDTLVRTILDLKENVPGRVAMGQRARAALEGRFDRPTLTRRWGNLLEALAAGQAVPTDLSTPQP